MPDGDGGTEVASMPDGDGGTQVGVAMEKGGAIETGGGVVVAGKGGGERVVGLEV